MAPPFLLSRGGASACRGCVVDDLQLQFNRRVLDRMAELSGELPADRELVELRELLLTMELTQRMRPPAKPPPSLDFWKLVPLLLTLALVLAAVAAALLGVDVRSLL